MEIQDIYNTGIREDFLIIAPKTKTLRKKIHKFDYLQIKNCFSSKVIIYKLE